MTCTLVILLMTKIIQQRQPKCLDAFSMLTSALGVPIVKKVIHLHSYLLFAPWLWGTFLLRSIYTGLLFHIFSNNVYHTMPQMFIEALDEGYTPVTSYLTYLDIKEISHFTARNPAYKPDIILNSSNQFIGMEYLEQRAHENLFAVIPQDFFTHYLFTKGKVGTFYVLPQILMQQQLCIYLIKHSILTEQFDKTILDLKAMGLPKHWKKLFLNNEVLSKLNKEEHKLIKQKDLFGCYAICCGFQILALIVFVLELLSIRVKKLKCLFS
uniref:Ionotropic glutamate receptor C-terminal domain-containing protein n=1 Tax=Stomoxys calcitrans TaxID=35570 RepID=A0A1I8NZ43_STOCA